MSKAVSRPPQPVCRIGNPGRRACHRTPKAPATLALSFLLLALVFCGCRTVDPLGGQTVDAAWKVQQGQAVWRMKTGGAEVAGELWLATSPRGATLLQFSKPMLPFVEARQADGAWQVRFLAQKQSYSGRGAPPARLAWLHLPGALAGRPPPPPWQFWRVPDGAWTLQNEKTGEALAGYFNP